MTIEPLAEDPFEILVGRIIDGTLNATPVGIALVAWVCDFVATEPHFVSLFNTADGLVLGQHNDDIGANDILGTLSGVMEQFALVCHNCGLTEAQTEKVLARVRQRLG